MSAAHLGASSVAALLGVDPWRSREDVLERLRGAPGPPENIYMAQGSHWGPIVPQAAGISALMGADAGSRYPELPIEDPYGNGPEVALVWPENDRFRAHLDGVLEDDDGRIVEVKTTSIRQAKAWNGRYLGDDGPVPLHYQIQCQAQIAIARDLGIDELSHSVLLVVALIDRRRLPEDWRNNAIGILRECPILTREVVRDDRFIDSALLPAVQAALTETEGD